jgi:hypothetical protein
MNPDPSCGKQDGSRTAYPALSGVHGCACATSTPPYPKGGAKAGYKAGSLRDGRADRGKTEKAKFAKFEISKLQNPKNKNLKIFITIFLRDRSRNCFPQDRILVLKISGKTPA